MADTIYIFTVAKQKFPGNFDIGTFFKILSDFKETRSETMNIFEKKTFFLNHL